MAISTLVPRLDQGTCRECSIRLFRECTSRPAPALPEAQSAHVETPPAPAQDTSEPKGD